MTAKTAFDLLTKKYPKAKIQLSDVSINNENSEIEVWSSPCEYNACGGACTDWFDFNGNHTAHKCK